jgi:L-fuculose-phosphate aldolase
MCELGARLWQRGLVGATEGNLSVRMNDSQILCTPSGVSKGHLHPDDLVLIDNNGASINGGVPSSEIKMHVRIYAKRPDCMAIAHAHPPIATSFALAGEKIPDNLLPEAMVVLGSVVNVPFCMPGTDDVPNGLEPFLANHKTFLLCNHGAVALGKDLTDAYHRMETLERVAQIILYSRTLGGPKPMPGQAFEELKIWLNGKL